MLLFDLLVFDANESNRQAPGDTPMLQTNRQAAEEQRTLSSLAAGNTPMLQTHIPFSRLVFNLGGRKMRAYWSADGKRPMVVVVHFISIINNKYDGDKYAKTVLWKYKISCTRVDGYDVMDIAEIKALLHTLPHTPQVIAKANALRYRSYIDAILTAFENGNASMIEDLGENGTWPADTPQTFTPPMQVRLLV